MRNSIVKAFRFLEVPCLSRTPCSLVSKASYPFAKTSKDKIIKAARKPTLEDELIGKKKQELKAISNSIVEKNKDLINSMPFDKLTQKMKQERELLAKEQQSLQDSTSAEANLQQNKVNASSIPSSDPSAKDKKNASKKQDEVKILVGEKEQQLTLGKVQFPWDFEGKNAARSEENMKGAVSVDQIINEKKAIELFKVFITAMEEYDYERLLEITEKKFSKRLCKYLSGMQNAKMEIKVDNLRDKSTTIELFKVTNIFGVGVEQNRRKNDSSDSYLIFDDLLNSTIPTLHIVQKRVEPKQLARIFMQLHLNFKTKTAITLLDKSNPQDSIKQDQIAATKTDYQYHTMVLEKIIIEGDYKSIRNRSISSSAPSKSKSEAQEILNNYMNVAGLKNLASADNFKIIDFDNYMKGNPLTTDKFEQD